MLARVPKGQAEKKRDFFEELGWVDLRLTALELGLIGSLRPQVDTNVEVVLLSLKVGQTGLTEMIFSGTKLVDGRFLITDRRIIVLSEKSGRIREFPYQMLEKWERPQIKNGKNAVIEYNLVFGTMPAKLAIKLVIVTKGSPQPLPLIPWVKVAFDQITGLHLFGNPWVADPTKAEKLKTTVDNLDSVFKAVVRLRNAGILA